MTYVSPIGSSPQQVEYRLSGEHGCETDQKLTYRTDARERPLRWIGKGLPAVGIEPGSVMTEADYDKARALMRGVHPGTGEVLVEPKLAIYEDSKVRLAPLVAAIRETAQHANVAPLQLLDSDRMRKAYLSAERAVHSDGESATRRADEAGDLAAAAGLQVEDVWDLDEYKRALGRLTQTVQVTNDDGTTTFVEVPRRQRVGNQGYDLTFTMPKSFSLFMAFSPDDVHSKVEDIYNAGVRDTFDWIEAETAYQMRGKHGGGKVAKTVPVEGFLGWTMVHRAARPTSADAPIGDPHWHVHVTVANMGRAEDGKWSTIAAGGRDLMRHIPAADKILQALVRHQLGERFGVRFGQSERTNLWEIVTFPDEVIEQFSKRGTSIEQALTALGFDAKTATETAKRVAESKMRAPKPELTGEDDGTLRAYWLAEAAQAGYDVEAMVRDAMGEAPADIPPTELEKLRLELLDPDTGLTAHRRRFSRLDAMALIADRLPGGIEDVAQLERLTDVTLRDERFPTIDSIDKMVKDRGSLDHRHLASSGLRTTIDVVEAEQTIRAVAAADVERRTVSPSSVQASIAVAETAQGYELSAEQVDAVARIVCSTAAVDTLLGPPGTGKTTMLRAARTAWESEGLRVLGTATAGVAVDNLQIESGINSKTIAQLRFSLESLGRNPLSEVDVLVIDESNLTDDRARAVIYKAAADAGTKIVEVGDHRQLRGVGCGSSFGVLHHAIAGAELSLNRRQVEIDERVVLDLWRQGSYRPALESWADRGRLVTAETGDDAMYEMVTEWLRQRAGAPDVHDAIAGVVMLAATNAKVDRINETTQAVRVANGELGPIHEYGLRGGGTIRLAEGDQVLLRVNDRGNQLHDGEAVLNGYRGVVTGADREGVDVEWRVIEEDGPRIKHARLRSEYIAAHGVQLGYAITAHKAEGLTIKADWTRADGTRQGGTVLADLAGVDAPGVYVAASRPKGRFIGYVGLDQVESLAQAAERGAVKGPDDLRHRIITEMTELAKQTRENANDSPVTADEQGSWSVQQPAASASLQQSLAELREQMRSKSGRVPADEPEPSEAGGDRERDERAAREEASHGRGIERE